MLGKIPCSSCLQTLSELCIQRARCSHCGYSLNAEQLRWSMQHREEYRGEIQDFDGSVMLVTTLAEKYLKGRILRRFGAFAVTTHGIEALTRPYYISNKVLKDIQWLEHMEEQPWVKISDFSKAYEHARDILEADERRHPFRFVRE